MDIESIEKNRTCRLKIIFADDVRRIVNITLPFLSPFLEGTVFHSHVKDHTKSTSSFETSAGLEISDQNIDLPPYYSEYMSNVFPFILPLCREGTMITPTLELSSEVHSFVNFMAGTNPIWCDFATYLSKPWFKFGIRFIPQPMIRVDQTACLQIINHPFLGECRQKMWIEDALGRLRYNCAKYAHLIDGQFELQAYHKEDGNTVRLTSSEMQVLFLEQPKASRFKKSKLRDGKYYSYHLTEKSAHYGSDLHFQLILLTEWLYPVVQSLSYKRKTKAYVPVDDSKFVELFKLLEMGDPDAKHP
jgi:hypothetical protein